MKFTIGIGAVLCAFTATAAPQNPAKTPLTLGQTYALVLENNPQLQAADFDTQAAIARVRQKNLGTPWEAGIDLENFAGNGQAKGTDSLEMTLSLGRVLEPGNKRQLRSNVAELNAGVLRHEQDAQRLDLLSEAASRFIALARAESEQALAERRVQLMQRTLKSVKQRFRVGKVAAGEVSRAEIGLAQAQLSLKQSQHWQRNYRRQLSVLWGELQPSFRGISADLFKLQDEPDFNTLEQLLEENPSLAKFATSDRLLDARLKLAEASGKPDMSISAGVRHLSASDDLGFTLGLQIPLGSRKRSSAYEQEAQALINREPLLKQNTELALRATLFGLHQQQLFAKERFDTLQSQIIPAAEKALKDYTRGYTAGRYSLLELTQAQETLLQARSEALDSAANHHEFGIQIDRLTGAALTTGVKQ